ncbi:hypothetical protein AMST5_00057 [freshwater sediment metagenome]|uniref:Helix-turn-helix domain-containing protein n=1 Tax=freshwater sediment metagenome TaxID=556182 RepID=A0AA48LWR3_9ZZZZ
MGNSDIDREIAEAAANMVTAEEREIFAAGTAFAAHVGPPTSALSQEAAAAWLGIPRRTLRTLIERGRLHVAEDGGLYAADLAEQLAVYRAHKAARKARRR